MQHMSGIGSVKQLYLWEGLLIPPVLSKVCHKPVTAATAAAAYAIAATVSRRQVAIAAAASPSKVWARQPTAAV